MTDRSTGTVLDDIDTGTDNPDTDTDKGSDTDTKAADATKATDATKDTADKDKGADKGSDALAGTVKGDDAGDGASTDWPDDWRTRLAGDDTKLLKRLERFGAPKDILDSFLNAEKKLSGKTPALTKPGKDATEEEVKAWREALGAPESADKYEIKLSNNRVIGDDDKPVVDSFLKRMHEAGMGNEAASQALDWYYDTIEQEQQSLIEGDEDYRDKTVQLLRDDWGPADFKRNMSAMLGLFEGVTDTIEDPETGEEMDLKTAILGARMPNGHKVGGDPVALRFLSKLGLELMPLDKEIPAGLTEGKVDDRLEAIRKMRRENPQEYEANRQKLEAEEISLIEAKRKREGREGGRQAA